MCACRRVVLGVCKHCVRGISVNIRTSDEFRSEERLPRRNRRGFTLALWGLSRLGQSCRNVKITSERREVCCTGSPGELTIGTWLVVLVASRDQSVHVVCTGQLRSG
ncbi:uncharacterized protein PHACADRAFT_256243 [Phanerochaete carnosa HHB-10118-sp]|uniref:Uncharacterized protein n=1 Tax=Phanerochaete carnosa (strain HHB-10118-sp) TaxID=650164 RepID=K5VVH7_PHACS|nr:uncharacterized protein PHACADRAFT_256243 [Phanerochaete carnosa HHB-10118-sp]EKM55543.1 hypothetical protein PHACADRAFT_256243 [Phanerochaete carnosa HHB-10118-sp]